VQQALKLLKNKSIINLGKECHGGNGMNINTLLGITTSTLRAYFTKQNVTANNVANMNTEDFKSSEAIMNEDKNGGVYVTTRKTGSSEVDLTKEMVDMMTTSEGLKANLKTLKTTDEMTKSIIDIKA
jgi:flagellar basal body rod protein FlgG